MHVSVSRLIALCSHVLFALATLACSKEPVAGGQGRLLGPDQSQNEASGSALADKRSQRAIKEPNPSAKETHELKIATWNIEWLNRSNGAGPVKRSKEDYTRLRKYARELDADLIALSEVHGAEAAARIFDQNLYDFHFSKGRGVQRTGFAYKNNLDVRPHPDLVALAHGGLRAGTDISLHLEGREMRLLAVHLKSGCFNRPLDRGKACKKLARQVPVVEKWIDQRASEGIAFALLGDFNRSFFEGDADAIWIEWNDGKPEGATLWSPTRGRTSLCWNSKHPHFIDHIVMGENMKRLAKEDSFAQHLFGEELKAFKPVLSDHCALSLELALKVKGRGQRRPEVYPFKTAPKALAQKEATPTPSSLGPIKGNVSRGGKKLFHTTECPSYAATVIEEHRGEQLFESTEEAEAAGFVRAGNCP